VFAEQLPKNDSLLALLLVRVYTGTCVCVLLGSWPTIRGGENL
jgi:hypothetical protein